MMGYQRLFYHPNTSMVLPALSGMIVKMAQCAFYTGSRTFWDVYEYALMLVGDHSREG